MPQNSLIRRDNFVAMLLLGVLCTVLIVAADGTEKRDLSLWLLEEGPYNPDIDLDTPNIIRRYDYPSETHVVKTADGYLLSLHRIPNGHNNFNVTQKPSVLIMHGLLSSSTDWIIAGPEKSLPYILADAGYDVWLGNARGNTYSRSHTSLSTSDPRFWDFSFDEMAYYDLPAMTDYILKITGNKQIFYIGHSMGTTMGFAFLSARKEYNDKIHALITLAPSTFFSNMQSPIRLLVPLSRTLDYIIHFLGPGEIAPNNEIMKIINKLSCGLTKLEQLICKNNFFLFVGYDPGQFNTSLLPLLLAHSPSGASARNLLHYTQLISSGNFAPYDCNSKMSYRKCIKPPPVESYNLDDITAPVALLYGNNDKMANIKDVEELHSKLKNVIDYYEIPFPRFNHIDFLWAIDANKLVYKKVQEIMDKISFSKTRHFGNINDDFLKRYVPDFQVVHL